MLRTSAPLIGALDGIKMADRSDDLDRVIGQTRWQKVIVYGACFAIVAIVAWFQSPPIGKTSEIAGTTVNVFGLPSGGIQVSCRLKIKITPPYFS